MILKYKLDKYGRGLNLCPNGPVSYLGQTWIGSVACSLCKHFGGKLFLRKAVRCNWEEVELGSLGEVHLTARQWLANTDNIIIKGTEAYYCRGYRIVRKE